MSVLALKKIININNQFSRFFGSPCRCKTGFLKKDRLKFDTDVILNVFNYFSDLFIYPLTIFQLEIFSIPNKENIKKCFL